MKMQYVGGVASYQCVNKSYTLIGPSTRECLSDGNWNGSAPTCIGKFMTLNEFLIHSSSKYEFSMNF